MKEQEMVLKTEISPMKNKFYFCKHTEDGKVAIVCADRPLEPWKHRGKKVQRTGFLTADEQVWLSGKLVPWKQEFNSLRGFTSAFFPMFQKKFPHSSVRTDMKKFREKIFHLAAYPKSQAIVDINHEKKQEIKSRISSLKEQMAQL